MKTWIPTISFLIFNELFKRYGLPYFTIFSWKSMCHTFVSFETTYAKLIEPISYSFYKDFPKFRCHNLGPSKVTGYSVFNFLKKVLIATSFQP